MISNIQIKFMCLNVVVHFCFTLCHACSVVSSECCQSLCMSEGFVWQQMTELYISIQTQE